MKFCEQKFKANEDQDHKVSETWKALTLYEIYGFVINWPLIQININDSSENEIRNQAFC